MDNFDIKSFALGVANGEGGGYPEPEGTKNITENGLYNIKDFAEANVNVPIDEPDLVDITITQNGTYNHPNKDGYDEVVVNVPIPPTPTGTISITQNGTYDVTNKASANVNVEGGGYPEPTGTISITQNATNVDVKDYASANVNVPNTYSSGDSGKVVSNGSLVSQTSTTKTANGTYDTTLNNSVTINVPNSYSNSDEGKVVNNGTLISQTSRNITANGTYSTPTNNEVVVNVPDSGVPQTGCTLEKNMSNRYYTFSYYGYENYYFTSTTIYKAPSIPYVGLGYFDKYLKNSNLTWKVSLIFRDEGHQVEYIPDKWAYASTSPALSKISQVSVVLPDAIKIIGQNAFDGAPLKSIYLKNVEWLYRNAFSHTNLTSVTIPSSVRGVDTQAFASCPSLQTVTFKGTPSNMGNMVFEDSSNLTDIYVPWSYGEVAGAPWGATNAQIHYNYTTS